VFAVGGPKALQLQTPSPYARDETKGRDLVETVVGILLAVMGIAIAGVWTRDIIVRDDVDVSVGFFEARDPSGGTLYWPHWIAEYGTATALVFGGIGLVLDAVWATVVAGLATGSLLYTSTNALGWALAEPERRPYAVPMAFGICVAVFSAGYLLLS
jgi:hypothetical protein